MKVVSIKEITCETRKWTFEENTPSFAEEIASLRAQVPPGELAKIPTDLSKRLDHYLYGIEGDSDK